jgi:hypothetical protein
MAFPETMPNTDSWSYLLFFEADATGVIISFKPKTALDLDGLCNGHLNSQL